MERKDYILTAQNLLFQGMDFASVEYMLEHCSIHELAQGETLLSPETANHHLYLILSGELSVRLVGQAAVQHAKLIAGDCVGDISIVDGKHPSALVVTTQHSRVLAVPHDTVWSLVNHSHVIARNLLGIIAGRMRNDNNAIISSQNQRMQFEHQATVDALTGIHNRRWMSEAFPRTLLRCARNNEPVSLLITDIDFFKRVNDTYGHLVGDTTLTSIASCLSENLRPCDLFVRYGGEEFAILLPGSGQDEATALAERLRTAVAACHIPAGNKMFQVTISIGLASARHEQTLEALLGEADHALYRAKEHGRNRVEAYSAADAVSS